MRGEEGAPGRLICGGKAKRDLNLQNGPLIPSRESLAPKLPTGQFDFLLGVIPAEQKKKT